MFYMLVSIMLVGAQSPVDVPQTETLTLDGALAEALANNRDLAAERAHLPIVDSRMISARLHPNPTLNLSADHLDALGTGFSPTNAAGPSEYSLNTEFTWERSGKRERRIELAERERTVVDYTLRDSVRRLTFGVQNAFIDILLNQESLSLARENLATLTHIAEINAARVRAGDLSELELVRVRLAVLDGENAVSQTDLMLRAARNTLHLLLGRTGPPQPFEVSGPFRRERLNTDGLEATALEHRPDLLALAADEARAAADIRLQLARAHPDPVLGTEYRRQQGINGTGNSLGFTASIPLQLFDHNQGEIARANAEKTQVTLKIAALRATIVAEVRGALDQLTTAQAQLDRIESVMLVQARQVREITEYSYQRGEASLLQFLDAERAYNDTMHNYANARAEYARSLYLIDSMTAKGVNP
jgi:outer membrane protein, heavy metal efflux system